MTARVPRSSRGAPRHAAGPGDAGFTLLEIMVAMVVLTLIVTTAFGALQLSERSWEAGLERTGETETLRTVAGLLQRQFSQVLPLTWTEGTQTYLAFDGDRERVRFIAPAPQHRGATGLFEITLAVERHASGARLVLYYRLHDPDSTGFQPEDSDRQRVLLADGLETAGFAYYGSPDSDDAPRWHAQWRADADAFPELVHARLLAGAQERQWPDLFLALHSGLSP